MPLNVQLNKSTPSNYRLVFPMLPNQTTLGASEELILNIHSTVLPGISLNPGELSWTNTKSKNAEGPLIFEEFNVDFIVDSEMKNWTVLYRWLMHITNFTTKMNEKYKEFSVDASLQILDNFNSEVLRIGFIRMWQIGRAHV